MSQPDVRATDGTVTSTVADGIGLVEFFHPKGNSLPGALLRLLATTIAETAANPAVRVIGLRSGGEGPYCAGASFDELVAINDAATGKEFFLGFARVTLAIVRSRVPVVTRVHGRVAGGGIGIVAASDYAIATQKAQLRLSELAVGIGPFVVGPAIERRIGPGAYAAMALDVEWRSADWALARDLYAQVHPDVAALDAAFHAMLQALAAANPDATSGIKRVLTRGTEGWEQLLDERAAMSGSLVLSEHTRKAIAEFRERNASR
ncbi:MAG: enoyl-CoA hydratase/isomerase family protein [Gemmatimonadetes bacterium]|nr:enoyl-CoA hydratase/isomerase family protein [Gemmatimonadota bacterium]